LRIAAANPQLLRPDLLSIAALPGALGPIFQSLLQLRQLR